KGEPACRVIEKKLALLRDAAAREVGEQAHRIAVQFEQAAQGADGAGIRHPVFPLVGDYDLEVTEALRGERGERGGQRNEAVIGWNQSGNLHARCAARAKDGDASWPASSCVSRLSIASQACSTLTPAAKLTSCRHSPVECRRSSSATPQRGQAVTQETSGRLRSTRIGIAL